MADFQNIDKKIKKLRNTYRSSEDRLYIDKMEKQLRKNLVEAQIADIPEIKALMENTVQKIENINLMLQWDRELTDDERKRLMDERKVHLFWVERLDASRATRYITELESFVDTKLSDADALE